MSEKNLTEDLSKVIEELEKKCRELPENIMAHHNLAMVYRKAGRNEDAIRELERCLEIDPNSVEAMVNLGALFFEQGMIDQALEANQKALKVTEEAAQIGRASCRERV